MSRRIVVCDTGPLIALALVDLLEVLPLLFSEVIVPSSVLREATIDLQKPGAQRIAKAIDVPGFREVSAALGAEFEQLANLLDPGEAEALTIAQELGAVVLIDEQRGRKVAKHRGIALTGTAGVLVAAKRHGEIDRVRPLLEKMGACGYRFSETIVQEVLRLCRE